MLVLSLGLCAPGKAENRAIEIVVVKRGGIAAYAEVAEEFAERCRVRARVVNLPDGRRQRPMISPPLHRGDVVLAVGQRALAMVSGSPAHVISALAPNVLPGVISADEVPPPELALRALKIARPTVRRIGVVHGPRTDHLVARLWAPAQALGLSLVIARAPDGPRAVRELHRIVATSPSVDALWLAPDLDVLTSQLFQYALTLEIQRALPIAAPTRHQVKSGALLSIDADPRAVGRQAAEITNRLLAGEPIESLRASGHTGSLELSVNADVARRLGANLSALVNLGARIE
ncbi:MAG: hypothetical protein EXR72_26905 [Myxococcales bacterium]|nr:hypothetical protein [Myxococcales bacterium]